MNIPFDFWDDLLSKSHAEIRDFFIEEYDVDIDSSDPVFSEEERKLFCALGKNIWALDISPKLKNTICKTGVRNLFGFFDEINPANRSQVFDEADKEEMKEFLGMINLDLLSTLDAETVENYWHFRYYEREKLN